MADIIDPQAIRFVNEEIRPLAEGLRAYKARVDAALLTWNGGINTTIGTEAGDIVQDGREDQGVSRLSGADVTNFVAKLEALQTQLDQAGVAQVVNKPCVRTLEVN